MIQDLYKAKKVLGVEVGTGASGLITDILLRWLELTIRLNKIITDIKLEEARIAHVQNNVEGSAPQVSVAT